MLGFDPFRFAGFGLALQNVMQPDIVLVIPLNLAAGAFEHDDGFDGVAAAHRERFIDRCF